MVPPRHGGKKKTRMIDFNQSNSWWREKYTYVCVRTAPCAHLREAGEAIEDGRLPDNGTAAHSGGDDSYRNEYGRFITGFMILPGFAAGYQASVGWDSGSVEKHQIIVRYMASGSPTGLAYRQPNLKGVMNISR